MNYLGKFMLIESRKEAIRTQRSGNRALFIYFIRHIIKENFKNLGYRYQ